MREGVDPQLPMQRPERLLETTLILWGFSFVLLLVFARTDLSHEYFFDEAWRADLIHSAHPLARMRGMHDLAPIPPLWVSMLHVSSRLLPDSFASLRLQGLVLASLLPALAGQLVRTIALARVAVPWRKSLALAALACAAVAAALDSFGLVTYLNDYLFQGALVLAMLLAWYYVDRGWARPTSMWPLLVLLAVGTIAGLFLLPVYAVWVYRSTIANKLLNLWLPLIVASCVAAAVYLLLYRGQNNGGVQAYWADHILRDGTESIREVIVLLLRTLGAFAVPSPIVAQFGTLAGVALLALAIVGLRELNGWWPWLGRSALVAWLVAAIASVIVGWPTTAVRLNVPFLSLWLVAAAVGLWRVIVICVRGRSQVIWSALAVVVAVLVVVNVVEIPNSTPGAFARGLDEDLNPIRDSDAPQVIVVAYHFMSKPYIHDGLVNEGSSARYQFIQESATDSEAMYSNLDAQIDGLQPVTGAEVWCVIPYDIGPDLAAAACQLDPTEFVEFYNERLNRAVLIGLRKVAAGA